MPVMLVSSALGQGTWKRISRGPDGVQSRGTTFWLQISADGRYILFANDGDNIMTDAHASQGEQGQVRRSKHLFWKDLDTDQIKLVDPPASVEVSIDQECIRLSRDGKRIAVAGTTKPTRTGSAIILVAKVDAASADQFTPVAISDGGPPFSRGRLTLVDFSGDRLLCIGVRSNATSNYRGQRTGGQVIKGIFSIDVIGGTASLVNSEPSNLPPDLHDDVSTSDDGSRIAFTTGVPLSDKDTNNQRDIYLYLNGAGHPTVRRISVSQSGIEGNGSSEQPHVSPDGRFIVFSTGADNLVPDHPKFKGWVVADTTNDAVMAVDSSGDSRIAFIDGPSVVTWGSSGSQYHIRSLSGAKADADKEVQITSPIQGALPSPVAISRDGRRLFFVTSEALDAEHDTNSTNDAYMLDLGTSIDKLNPVEVQATDQHPSFPALRIAQPAAPLPANDVGHVAAPENSGPAHGANHGDGPLEEATLKRIAGDYSLSTTDATGATVSDTLHINPDGTATLKMASDLGINSLAITGRDLGIALTLNAIGEKDGVSVRVLVVFEGGAAQQCLVMQMRGNQPQKYYQMTMERKKS